MPSQAKAGVRGGMGVGGNEKPSKTSPHTPTLFCRAKSVENRHKDLLITAGQSRSGR